MKKILIPLALIVALAMSVVAYAAVAPLREEGDLFQTTSSTNAAGQGDANGDSRYRENGTGTTSNLDQRRFRWSASEMTNYTAGGVRQDIPDGTSLRTTLNGVTIKDEAGANSLVESQGGQAKLDARHNEDGTGDQIPDLDSTTNGHLVQVIDQSTGFVVETGRVAEEVVAPADPAAAEEG